MFGSSLTNRTLSDAKESKANDSREHRENRHSAHGGLDTLSEVP